MSRHDGRFSAVRDTLRHAFARAERLGGEGRGLRRVVSFLRRNRFGAACALFALSLTTILVLLPDRQPSDMALDLSRAGLFARDSVLDGASAPAAPWRIPEGAVAPGRFAAVPFLRMEERLPGAGGETALLYVATRPAGAQVLVDGEPAGLTPLRQRLPLGRYQLSVHKQGYVTLDTTLEHRARWRSSLLMKLRPQPASARRRKGALMLPHRPHRLDPVETAEERNARLWRYIQEVQARDGSTTSGAPRGRGGGEEGRTPVRGW